MTFDNPGNLRNSTNSAFVETSPGQKTSWKGFSGIGSLLSSTKGWRVGLNKNKTSPFGEGLFKVKPWKMEGGLIGFDGFVDGW